MTENCPFCEPDNNRLWFENSIGKVLWDAFPVSKGHALVVPRQHVASIFGLPIGDQRALWALVAEARQRLNDELHPDGLNIGLNDGLAAGQTVMHAHIHLIPRNQGDIADPRGGIRWIFPEKARYW